METRSLEIIAHTRLWVLGSREENAKQPAWP